MASFEEGERPDTPSMPDELETALERFLTENGKDTIDRSRYEAVADYVQESLAKQDRGHKKIDTHSGKKIRPLDPAPEKIDLDDIAHGLSNLGRFAGQGKEFYSVARHSVRVSHEVEARGGNVEEQRYALVHDAAEAYLSDVPGPVKKSLPGYKHVERRLDAAIIEALGLNTLEIEKESVKQADKVVGKQELAVQFPARGYERPDNLQHDPSIVEIYGDNKKLFLNRARSLGFK